MDATVTENLLMGYEDDPEICRAGVLNRTAVRDHAARLLGSHGVKTSTPLEPARSLSGGNRQKLVIGREMTHAGDLLIAEQPTRGVDIGATEQIYQLLIEYRDRGRGVLLVSTDLTEILALADRILVLYEGRIVGEMPGPEATEEAIGLLMGGGGPC